MKKSQNIYNIITFYHKKKKIIQIFQVGTYLWLFIFKLPIIKY